MGSPGTIPPPHFIGNNDHGAPELRQCSQEVFNVTRYGVLLISVVHVQVIYPQGQTVEQDHSVFAIHPVQNPRYIKGLFNGPPVRRPFFLVPTNPLFHLLIESLSRSQKDPLFIQRIADFQRDAALSRFLRPLSPKGNLDRTPYQTWFSFHTVDRLRTLGSYWNRPDMRKWSHLIPKSRPRSTCRVPYAFPPPRPWVPDGPSLPGYRLMSACSAFSAHTALSASDTRKNGFVDFDSSRAPGFSSV